MSVSITLFVFFGLFLYTYGIFIEQAEGAVGGDNTVLSPAESTFLEQLQQFQGIRSGTGISGVPQRSGTSRGVGKLQNPINFNSLRELVEAIVDIIIQIAVPIAALFLIYSGFLFVSARGNDDQLKTAKSIFLWTVVGIAVLLGAKILAGIIDATIKEIRR